MVANKCSLVVLFIKKDVERPLSCATFAAIMEKTGSDYKGKISFINYEKRFATIEYTDKNKHKSINCKIDKNDPDQKLYQYRLHDTVSFALRLSDRGDKMAAYDVKFLYNEFVDLMIQKAAIENRFAGYLKVVDGKFFVKEVKNYILFPVQLSRWEKEPVETAVNVTISFKLLHLDKPRSVAAELFSHSFIPEYKKAQQHFKHNMPIEAVVYKVSPHAVYLDLFGDRLQAKLVLTPEEKETIKPGDTIPVLVTHLTANRIVVKKATVVL